MTRGIPSEMADILAGNRVSLFYAVEALFDSGAIRLWTGHGDRVIGGETYTGAGYLLSVSGMEESNDLSAKGAKVRLSGNISSLVSLALQEPFQNRRAKIIFGVERQPVSGWVLENGRWKDAGVWDDTAYWRDDASGIFYTVEVFAGIMDKMSMKTGGTDATIDLTIESKYVSLQRANVRRYTPENHKLRHPSDTFFDWVPSLQDKEIAWGRKTS